ncbi:hypothetical protein NITGR_550003 [Nitrospina gracilis 3/211]|uniref:Uncharacterized protein n=1 Tax=Nitrospina gracilis (strain 3/211) TaxID=1266370 RepID=M1Z0F3_NITG3|nr:hypothetical protein NITGR_550003 [Nitrospina gracilis 3/211]
MGYVATRHYYFERVALNKLFYNACFEYYASY